MDGSTHYQIDEYLSAVAKKHSVDVDEIKTHMMDGVEFNSDELGVDPMNLGC